MRIVYLGEKSTGPPHPKPKFEAIEDHSIFHNSINRRTLNEAKIKS